MTTIERLAFVKDNDRPRAVVARHAASLLVWRQGPTGPEVLMGIRGAGHRFVPNRLVFPGGAVDPADRRAAVASELPGHALEALRHRTEPRLARALAVAAARELHEETGLSLGQPPHLGRMDYLCRAVTPVRSPIRFNARFLAVPADAASGNTGDSRELHAVRFYSVDEAGTLDLMAVTKWVLACLVEHLANPHAPQRLRVFRREQPGFET